MVLEDKLDARRELKDLFLAIKKRNKISSSYMAEEFSESWGCSRSSVLQYLDQTFLGGIPFSRIDSNNTKKNNYVGSHSQLSISELHATRIVEIMKKINPKDDEIYRISELLEQLNPNCFPSMLK